MINQSGATRDMIQKLLKELDEISQETMETLNTVAGTERIIKWKARTAALITDTVGRREGETFASIQPGPSFTHDMVEEFTDLVECYRTPLKALAKQLSQPPSTGS